MVGSRVLWGVGTSRTMRPHWMLAELGLDYETREIVPRTDTMNDPEFCALNRRGKVPVFQDGDRILGESGAILLYLGDRYREGPKLVPEAGSDERSEFNDLFLFVLTELDATALYVVRRHQGLPETYGEAPQAVAAAKDYFLRGFEVVDRQLAEGGPFLRGADFSAADILVGTVVDWARHLGYSLAPHVLAYQQRYQQRSAYRTARDRNFPPHALRALGLQLPAVG